MTVEDVIERWDYFAHHGDLVAAVEAWEETGMEAGEVEEWLSARCFDADAAEDLDDVGPRAWPRRGPRPGAAATSTRWATRLLLAIWAWKRRANCLACTSPAVDDERER